MLRLVCPALKSLAGKRQTVFVLSAETGMIKICYFTAPAGLLTEMPSDSID